MADISNQILGDLRDITPVAATPSDRLLTDGHYPPFHAVSPDGLNPQTFFAKRIQSKYQIAYDNPNNSIVLAVVWVAGTHQKGLVQRTKERMGFGEGEAHEGFRVTPVVSVEGRYGKDVPFQESTSKFVEFRQDNDRLVTVAHSKLSASVPVSEFSGFWASRPDTAMRLRAFHADNVSYPGRTDMFGPQEALWDEYARQAGWEHARELFPDDTPEFTYSLLDTLDTERVWVGLTPMVVFGSFNGFKSDKEETLLAGEGLGDTYSYMNNTRDMNQIIGGMLSDEFLAGDA